MKKISFKGSFHLSLISVLSIFLAVSCKKQTMETVSIVDEELVAAQKGKPNTLQTVSLRVTVSNIDPVSGLTYNIQNDGGGDYINGLQNVQAVLDQSGTFAFNTRASWKPNNPAVRWVTYNFNNPVDPNNSYRPSPTNNNNYHFSTGPSSFGTNPYKPIQLLGINGNPASECIYMGNSIANNSTTWRVSFHKGYEDVSNSPTSFAVVTRTSINPAVWTIQPMGACSPTSNVAALRSDAGELLHGYYNIPFLFTLRAQ